MSCYQNILDEDIFIIHDKEIHETIFFIPAPLLADIV